VSGTSAGAGLAAALALLARDRGELPLRFQVLDAPMIDDRQVTPSSQLDDLVIFGPFRPSSLTSTCRPGNGGPAPSCLSTEAGGAPGSALTTWTG
jgi:acetyl esterase/lipase